MNRFLAVWRLLNYTCHDMTRLASESLDRDLSWSEKMALRSHLVHCSACRRYTKQVVFLRTALQTLATRIELDEGLPGPSLPEEVCDRIKLSLKN